MRILLIRHHFTRSNNYGTYPRSSDVYPPMGLASIATVIKQDDHNDIIEVLDSRVLNLSVNQTKSKIKTFNPEIIGITTISETVPGAIEAGEICKELFPNVLRIIGGPHMSIDPEEIMKLGIFQIGVIGEGEITMLEIVKDYKKSNEMPDSINGTIIYNNGSLIKNDDRPRIKDLDTLPIPDRHYFDNDLYGHRLTLKPWTYMTISRGCPYKCAFCSMPVWGRKTSFNSSRRAFEEMKICVNEFKIREIWFRDDTFTAKRKNILELCNLIINENLKVRWTVFSRVDTVDEEMIKALRNAGCYKIDFGVESGDQSILDLMKKGITIKQIRNAFAMCRKNGMQTHAFIMIGYPRETIETIKKTIKLTKEIADWASFSAVSIIKGTGLYDLAVKEKYYIPKPMDFLLGQSEKSNHCDSKELPTQTIIKLTSLAYKQFYLRPFHILRLLILMIKDGTVWDFIRISPYVLIKLFGKYRRVEIVHK